MHCRVVSGGYLSRWRTKTSLQMLALSSHDTAIHLGPQSPHHHCQATQHLLVDGWIFEAATWVLSIFGSSSFPPPAPTILHSCGYTTHEDPTHEEGKRRKGRRRGRCPCQSYLGGGYLSVYFILPSLGLSFKLPERMVCEAGAHPVLSRPHEELYLA